MAMEKLAMFCIFDAKMELYMPPYCSMNRAVGSRMFETLVGKPGDFNEHSEDYALWETGSFDQETSETTSIKPVMVVEAKTIISRWKDAQ